jgi:hypothetical protein
MSYVRMIAILGVIGLLFGVMVVALGGFMDFSGTTTGTLEGTVWSYGCPAIKPGENCGFPASNYEVMMYRVGGSVVFAQTRTDANGFYRITLPEGKYAVYGDCHILIPCTSSNGTPHEVTIRAGQVTVLNITYDNGIR